MGAPMESGKGTTTNEISNKRTENSKQFLENKNSKNYNLSCFACTKSTIDCLEHLAIATTNDRDTVYTK